MLKFLIRQADTYFDVFTTIWFIFYMSIAERIRTLRNSRNLSQRELGERIGRTQQEIYRWEKGLVRVHADDVRKMADALDVPVTEFYDDACAGEQVDWELQTVSSHMPQKDRQKLIDFLRTAYPQEHDEDDPLPS